MLKSTLKLIGFSLATEDGEIGKVIDFYFNDQNWKIQYLIVETGNWLFGRKVLISPYAVQGLNWESNLFNVNMTRDQVKSSPTIDTELPVSKQMEKILNDHYAWPYSGGAGMGFPTTGMIKGTKSLSKDPDESSKVDKHLRSYKHVSDYKVYNPDGLIGETEDFLVNIEDWTLPYLIVKMTQEHNMKKIAVATDDIDGIDFNTYAVSLSVTLEQLENVQDPNLGAAFL